MTKSEKNKLFTKKLHVLSKLRAIANIYNSTFPHEKHIKNIEI